ncbi:hypothetical protein T484DRAFT_1776362, partial [Baffinella frigidus]
MTRTLNRTIRSWSAHSYAGAGKESKQAKGKGKEQASEKKDQVSEKSEKKGKGKKEEKKEEAEEPPSGRSSGRRGKAAKEAAKEAEEPEEVGKESEAVEPEASKDVAEAVEAEVITLRCSNAAFDVSDARFNSDEPRAASTRSSGKKPPLALRRLQDSDGMKIAQEDKEEKEVRGISRPERVRDALKARGAAQQDDAGPAVDNGDDEEIQEDQEEEE